MNRFFAHMFAPGWETSPASLIGIVWTVWAISWFAAAVWSRQTAARAGFVQEAPYRIITLIGIFFLFGLQFQSWPDLWPVGQTLLWAVLVFVVAGFAFAWWARIHLGTLWSGTITRKEGHRIVESGPYALVRHPIYTGLLLGAFATAVARSRWEAIIGAALFALGCWIKASQEERFLSEELGAEYADFRKRVPMLVPLVGWH